MGAIIMIMALVSLEIASDGLLASRNSLSMAVRGLLKTAGVIATQARKYVGFIVNVGSLMNR